MELTFRVYFAQGNQALLKGSDMIDIMLYLLKHEDYYHSIIKIELVD